MKFPISKTFIELNPRFRLAFVSRPGNISKGQRTIIFDVLLKHQSGISLTDLGSECMKDRYSTKHEIRKSILYHLNRIESVELA
jgi:hypothetical protein